MRKAAAALGLGVVATLTISGCAVPVTIAAAGYALTGFTLIDEGKTVSDVLLSAAMDEDCALWRIVQDQPVCIDVIDDGTVVAVVDDAVVDDAAVDAAAVDEVAEVAGKAPKSTASN